jgi:hypothetical protein
MTRSEFRWLLLASLAVLAVASLPTIFAAAQADADHVFTGFIYNNEDGNSYLGKMRLGAQGEWLFDIFYTAEPTSKVLAFSFHLLLGRLAAATGLSLLLTYHLARVVFGLGLLLTIYVFLARFTPDVTARRVAWLLVAVGGGLGWLLMLLGLTHWLGAHPLEFWVPEGFAFLVLLNLPHLAVAESLLYWALLWLLDAAGGAGPRRALLAGLAGLLMTLVVPFYALILGAAVGAWLLALAVRQRQIPWRQTGLALLVGLPSVPLVAYTTWMWNTDPGLQAWTAQNIILSPHPLHYLLAYAPLLIPALVGGIVLARQRDDELLLPLAWLLIVPILLYIPFNLQRRLLGGIQAPLALLAGVGLVHWLKPRTSRRRLALVGYVAVASLSTWLLVGGSLLTALQKAPPAYRPAAEVLAVDWLATHALPDSTVLSDYPAGNLIPARAAVRVFYGHTVETFDSGQKRKWVEDFFALDSDDSWRQTLLADFGVDYVFYGPQEQALGDWDPATAPYLTLVYDEGGYAIYQVAEKDQP